MFANFAKKIKSGLARVFSTRRGKVLTCLCAAATMLCLLTSFVVMQLNSVIVNEDGKEIASFTTVENEQNALLKDAGITLGADDKVEMNVDGRNITLNVKRAFPVTVKADEHIITVMVIEGTDVAHVLEKAGVSYSESDKISAETTDKVTSGMEISVVRRTSKEIKVTETVAFETETRKTDDLYKGETEIEQAGKDGEKELTYRVSYENGKEVARTLINTEITKEAQNEIKLMGTKEKKTVVPAGNGGKVDLGNARMIQVTATAYCNTSDGGQVTALGQVPSYGTVAVDPRVIPLGTKMYICSPDGSYVYGYCVAGDTGGAIKGNRVDLFLGSESECRAFGRRTMCVYILD